MVDNKMAGKEKDRVVVVGMVVVAGIVEVVGMVVVAGMVVFVAGIVVVAGMDWRKVGFVECISQWAWVLGPYHLTVTLVPHHSHLYLKIHQWSTHYAQ